ncbi:P-loop containing nucleoside triphosphate hydrolase protein [Tothia fuscella]|uniref:P-loop containing nucleoside triphosphate hydrolase protein n=1 Tax=Tothia fuscella TaxID=1048955 RepID=A0A9P4NGW1_9PEZI|nr:P-loop containing nucleoside triphosphate hydrolase protein [Tothia fuscella]
MASITEVHLGTNGQVSSNESTPTLYENASSNSSLESLTQLNITTKIAEITVNKVSDEQIAEEEDISITLMSTNILEIIFDYALNKFDDCRDRLEAGRPKFISVINKFVRAGVRVDMSLPAFPFKSANKVYKALGTLPDKAEEIALARLHNMCRRIENIYAPGAKVILISDGLVYNDLLSISDRDTWFYGEALREMAVEKGFTNIGFSRLRDFVVNFTLPETLDEIHYVANATNFRRFVLNKWGKDDLDVDQLIAVDEDTRLTYQGYRRFLMSDLRHIFTLGGKRTSNEYKRETKYLAKQMLVRGYAFAGAIKANFPNHLRLSIHQSTGEHKVSMSLLNTKTGFTTPWHCSIALMADGEWMSAPMGDFKENPRMKVMEENGRPSYFKEMTEEEFQEEQKRLAEEAARLAEKPVVEEKPEQKRNENFVHWEGVTCDVERDGKSRRKLDHLDGWLRGGTLTALMGVSGAGKSHLLNLLANRPTSGVVRGDILVNGRIPNATVKNVGGLVHQQDLQLATATVREALIFSAVLRQPKTTSYVEKIAYAEEVINLIGLEALANTAIGTSGEGLNSEQRKRLAIGVELAAKPTTLLLLDQPLAGLDSQAALSICLLLRKLASKGLAILCIINQPSSRLLQSFDRLILLGKGGKQLYFGKIGSSCKTITSYFQRYGARPCNTDENPAEWMLEVTSSATDADGAQDWSETWVNSPEFKAVKSKLAHLKEKFSEKEELTNGHTTSDTHDQPAVAINAIDLQRTYYKYLKLENIDTPAELKKPDLCRCCLTSHASANRPAYLL